MTVRSWTEHQVECDSCRRLGPASGESAEAALKLAEADGWVADPNVANCPSCRVQPLGTFFDAVKTGDATSAMFNLAVDAWLPEEMTLAAHLGMTESQYQFFLESSTELGIMLRSRVT